MKKSLAIAVAAAMMLGICPTAAPVNAADSDYKYVYASLDWAEYWQNENVYLASGSTLKSSSEEADARGEYDKGAFDVVTRATKNHGLHRGSFQCDAVIRDTDGKAYEISYWTSEEVSAKDENGQEYFWGFTIVILRVPDIFSDSINALSNFGYEYKLSKTPSPWDDTYEVVYQSDGNLTNPVSYDFTIGEENWIFELMPENGWGNTALIAIIIGFFTSIVFVLSVLIWVWLTAKENKNRFQKLAHMDPLTNIYNRYGFDELAEEMIAKNPNAHYVVALFDIDDFKFINDIYGHFYGDRALKNLADSMKKSFPSDALLGRNGGDEFCILLPNRTYDDAKEQLQQFTMLPKIFSYKGNDYPFYISLGYAEYPTAASNRAQLMRCADAALYEVKLHGKNGCMAYKEGLQSGVRKQLGFALKDISEHLPGAFIIYRADKENDELFYANHEFLHMAGYKDIDELFKLTKKSFRNLIREDEQQQIEASIWKQIDNGNENDYIYFHLRKADGTYLSVLDHGRIVENQQYGRVFYVLFMDWADMHIRYSDKFSE